MTPADLADRPLFEPIADLLKRFPYALPDWAAHNALLAAHAPQAASGSGAPIHFVPPPLNINGYEAHIHATGAVPTRADDWHDFFNALAWCVWPAAKAACNALHLHEIARRHAAGESRRGPLRDALTQFDECGMVVVTSDARLAEQLAAHQWEAVLWQQRARLADSTRFLVFGHGTWDSLRAPFFGLCAKALYRVVDAAWFNREAKVRQRDTDAWLAAQLLSEPFDKTHLRPLPLLGIPGVTADSESADYYRDTRQFRPLAGTHRATGKTGL